MKRNYIATLEQVGSFTSLTFKGGRKLNRSKDKNVKSGGNVVTYFCTPEREVIHFVVGPVPGEMLAEAADWAADAHATIAPIKDAKRRAEALGKLHGKVLETWKESISAYPRLGQLSSELAKIKNPTAEQIEQLFQPRQDDPWGLSVLSITPVTSRLLLSQLPLVPLETIEKPVFEYLAGQLGCFGRRSERSDELLARARESFAEKRPLLLVVEVPKKRRANSGPTVAQMITNPTVARYAKRYCVIHLRQPELIALFDDLELEPPPAYARWAGGSQIVAAIIGSDGQRSYGFSKANNQELKSMMRRILSAKRVATLPSSPSAVSAEVAAEKKLRLAKKLVGKNPKAARKRLESIVRQFPNTRAAATAQRLMASK